MAPLTLLLILVVLVVLLLIFCLPSYIANSRGLSEGHKSTVLLLSLIGLLIPLTWLIALVLACVYEKPAPRRRPRPAANQDWHWKEGH